MSARTRSPFDQFKVSESGLWLRDNTIADASITRHGLVPKLPNDATKFYNGVGGFTVPPGSATVPDWALYDPLTPPSGYNATVTDTFPGASGASLDAKWTKTGAITLATLINGGLTVTGGTSASTQVGLIEQVAPSTPYTIAVQLFLYPSSIGNTPGIYVRESAGGKFWTNEMFRNSGAMADLWMQVARYASTSSRTSIAGQVSRGLLWWYWLRITNDGTTLTAEYSWDGRRWHSVFAETIAASNLNGTTINRVGIKWDNLSATAGHGCFREFLCT